jgi:hypothetical protein
MPGQPQLGTNPFIGIDCTRLDVLDSVGGPSNLVINVADPFQLATEWKLDGIFANFLVALPLTYKVTYYYEGLGGAPEGEFPGGVGPKATVAGQLTYGAADTTLNVPAGTLPVGTYMLTVVITFPTPSAPMTAFAQGPVIQIFGP